MLFNVESLSLLNMDVFTTKKMIYTHIKEFLSIKGTPSCKQLCPYSEVSFSKREHHMDSQYLLLEIFVLSRPVSSRVSSRVRDHGI